MFTKLLNKTAEQLAPQAQKANAASEFIKNQPVLFGVIIVVSVLVLAAGAFGLYILKNQKKKRR